ncbi:MAG TPA: hypothetical protein VKZ96_09405 [Thermomicrobiales bacterium]|nr:hypothetical protein [Thermomicrobiales bacterium]
MNQEHTTVTTQRLEAEGFSPEQIAKLEQLRACYPLIELTDEEGWKQLQFLRWLCRQGQYPSG